MIRTALAAPSLAARRSAALSALSGHVPAAQLALPALSATVAVHPTLISATSLRTSTPFWAATPTSTHSRALHTSANPESAALVLGLTVAGAAVAGIYGIKAWEKYKATAAAAEKEGGSEGAEPGEPSAATDGTDSANTKSASSGADSSTAGNAKAEAAAKEGEKSAPKSSSSGGIFGAQAFAKRFYRGPFEDKMTRREAGLILGVRCVLLPGRLRKLILTYPAATAFAGADWAAAAEAVAQSHALHKH